MRVSAIAEADRIQFLIAVIGPEGYNTLKGLASPAQPRDVTYETASRLLTRHYEPRHIVIAERA